MTGLKVICLNARSVLNKKSELQLLVEDEKPDVLAITESWAHKLVNDAELSIAGYQMFRRDRVDKMGGGVLLYILNNIEAKERAISKINNFKEFLCCDLMLAESKLTLLLCYRPPNSTSVMDTGLFKLLREVSKGKVIMGDLNYANIDWKEHCARGSGKRFMKVVNDCFLDQMVCEPTRGNRILDVILTSDRHLFESVRVTEGLGDSDHEAVNCIERKKVLHFYYYYFRLECDLLYILHCRWF
jgi:Endonuclease-reverse transcriptase